MANVSLDETLFYQYMINHNSTSTMLNAISGTDTDESSSMLTSVLNTLQTSNNLGTSSISDVSTLLGLDTDSYSSIGSLDSFSSILQTYLQNDTTEAAQLMEQLEQAMDEVAGTEEESSRSYQTLQELYEYFSEKTSGKAAALTTAGITEETSAAEQSTTSNTAQSLAGTSSISFDFDSFESETDEMMDSVFEEVSMKI